MHERGTSRYVATQLLRHRDLLERIAMYSGREVTESRRTQSDTWHVNKNVAADVLPV